MDVGNNLYIVELATNKATQLTEGYNLDYFAYPSRDGKKVFFGANGCIKAVRLDNLQEEIIVRAQDLVKEKVVKCSGAFPSWDGKKLICFYEAAPEYGLIVVDLVTGDKKIILQGDQHVRHMQFCPNDNNLILFAHEGGSKKGIRSWLINADGSNYRPVRDCVDRDREEAVSHEFWANTSRKVYFTIRKQREGKTYIACVDLETNKEETLFEVNTAHGTITQDDKYIICDSKGDNGEIWITSLATRERKPLCHHNFIWAERGVSSRDEVLKASRLHPHPTVSYTTNKCIYTTNDVVNNAGVFIADIPSF
jgi:Tol biopolymer transport system component